MNYTEAIEYLEKASMFGSKKYHENFSKLLSLLGDPHKGIKYIHIAGTNGKGSVSSMLYSILLEQGYNTGLFTSPHLERYNERFSFNGDIISDEEFALYTLKVKNAAEIITKGNKEYFCFFEIVTAMAFLWFHDKNAEYAVLETGMGGRLDNTNIIDESLVSVITNISLDHTAYLGDTVEKIAWEKAGIIKEGCPVVVYPQKKSVYQVIKAVAEEKKAKMYYTENYNYTVFQNNFDGIVFSACNSLINYDKIKLGMIGSYQVSNACNALVAVKALRDRGVLIDDISVRQGLEKAKINGRMEILSREPFFIIDAAHNEGGVEQLCSYIKGIDRNVTLLVGVLADKDYKKMINALYDVADSLIITSPVSKRALNAHKLAESLEHREKLTAVEEDISEALKKALETAKDIIICCGSVYLIGDIRRKYRCLISKKK